MRHHEAEQVEVDEAEGEVHAHEAGPSWPQRRPRQRQLAQVEEVLELVVLFPLRGFGLSLSLMLSLRLSLSLSLILSLRLSLGLNLRLSLRSSLRLSLRLRGRPTWGLGFKIRGCRERV